MRDSSDSDEDDEDEDEEEEEEAAVRMFEVLGEGEEEGGLEEIEAFDSDDLWPSKVRPRVVAR